MALIGVHDMHELGANGVAVGLFQGGSDFSQRGIGFTNIEAANLEYCI